MNNKLYFEKLFNVMARTESTRRYRRLLEHLSNVEYVWDLSMHSDANRAADGLAIRKLYLSDADDTKPCSVLEMLTALSFRIERDITGEPGNDHPEHWFWEMLDNLGLLEYTDDHYDEDEVDTTLDIWMNREYRMDGRGGLFPVRYALYDMRDLPIWEQFALYLNEKGDF